MGDIPSLLSLCTKAIKSAIIYGDYDLENIFELPLDLFYSLLVCLPPLALQKLHKELPHNFLSRECNVEHDFTTYGTKNARKRARFEHMPPRSISYLREQQTTLPLCCKEFKTCRNYSFNKAWKTLFDSRWPANGNHTQLFYCMMTQDGETISEQNIYSRNWQYLYWEAHLQNCLDEAAAQAFLPVFQGFIGEITMPDTIMKCIGYKSTKSGTIQEVSKLSYHCQQFGCYARYLRLQNVLCVAEMCELLRNSRLQAIAFRGIKSKNHVDGICKLLNQNSKTLSSLEFVLCRLTPTALDNICDSLYGEENPSHGIQYFSIKCSRISIGLPASLPTRFLSFLASGRSLCSLKFSDSGLGSELTKMIFDTLLDSFSGLSCLEVSEDMISGLFSGDDGRLSSSTPSSLGIKSLKELRVLNLRGNNLSEDNAQGLKSAMLLMPHLQSLDISDNPIGDDGIRILVPYFAEVSDKGSCLVDIKIENCDLSCLGAAVLLSRLSESLRSLSIAHNSLGSRIATSLVNFLQTSHIKVLNIEAIDLALPGFVELEEAMPDALGLTSFNMSKNRGGYGAANLLSKLILRAPELLTINASYNFIRPESLDSIYTALKQSKGKIKRLDLTEISPCCNLTHTSMFNEFQFNGKPIVIFSSFHNSMTPYDDDP